MNKDNETTISECIENCVNCYAACNATIEYFMQKGDAHSNFENIAILMECAEICRNTADFMIKKSKLSQKDIETCTTICKQCIELCESLECEENIEHCATICRKCMNSFLDLQLS